MLEIGVVPGLQGIRPERGQVRGAVRLGREQGGSGACHNPPCLLGEVKFAEGDSVFDEECEVLSLDQQRLPVGGVGRR